MKKTNKDNADLETGDPFLWLEDITGEKAADWVKARNAETEKAFAGSAGFAELENDLLRILDSKEKIPFIAKQGRLFYNLWQDERNPRGLWRRTTMEEYRKREPAWETVLDIDALGKAEDENWVFHGAEFLKPACRRCLVSLSRGGADAAVVREFDMVANAFVTGGFTVSEAKTRVSWIDDDSIFISTDFGPGSLTASGYPRIAKLWKRGTPLSAAEIVFEADGSDMMAFAYHDSSRGFERDFLVRLRSFFSTERFLLMADGQRVKIDLPDDANAHIFREWLLISLRTPWTVADQTFSAGALVAARFDDFIAGRRELTLLHAPTETASRADFCWTRSHLILSVLDDVKTKAWALSPGAGAWRRESLRDVPAIGTVGIWPVDSEDSDDYFMNTTDFLTPTILFTGRVGREPEKLKEMPAFFKADGLETTQHFVLSDDGTRIPYFQVSRQGLSPDGSHPTILTGYGGFEISMLPNYSGITGRAWLEQGGLYVVANIRGGGEYGPRWHQAALKANRPRAYEDFAAVARDLISRGVTSPAHLGITGGSNGGLLVGNLLFRNPELFGAAVCSVPLLDMKRYSRLLAGASWMEEYGDPEKPEEWEFIRGFSPYHNIKPGAAYPPVLFMTTTRDDRVHPGHARKMAALMQDLGYEAYFWENTEGGHGAGADNNQVACFFALGNTFMWKKLT